MALIEVQRVSGGYTEHLHPFDVVINDQVVGWLGPGESGAFEVAPGRHELFVEVDWCRSERVDAQVLEEQAVSFRCETRANLVTDAYWATLGRRRYLRLTQVSSEDGRRSPQSSASESMPPQRPTDAKSGRVVSGETDETTAPPAAHIAFLGRQSSIAALLLIAVGILAFAMTRGVGFLAAISIITIGVQSVLALNYHLLASRAASRPDVKSNEPFRFRIIEQATISAALALAGAASLVGILPASTFAGWLAVGAAAAGAANIIATRHGTTGRRRQAS